MNEQDKDKFILFVMLWMFIGGLMGMLGSCSRAVAAVYHQVIIKDQAVWPYITK
jgi:hypothetical protein